MPPENLGYISHCFYDSSVLYRTVTWFLPPRGEMCGAGKVGVAFTGKLLPLKAVLKSTTLIC